MKRQCITYYKWQILKMTTYLLLQPHEKSRFLTTSSNCHFHFVHIWCSCVKKHCLGLATITWYICQNVLNHHFLVVCKNKIQISIDVNMPFVVTTQQIETTMNHCHSHSMHKW
jgi:hypothetical protein